MKIRSTTMEVRKMDVRVITIPVKEIMTPNPFTIAEDKTIAEAAKSMEQRRIGCLLVDQQGETVGIITETDITRKVVAKGINPKETKVGEVMSQPVRSVNQDTPVNEVYQPMAAYGVRHLMVTDENKKAVGIVSVRDILYPRIVSSP
ncbi:MAG: CBS domain-containing protein [bacterium]